MGVLGGGCWSECGSVGVWVCWEGGAGVRVEGEIERPFACPNATAASRMNNN